MGVADTLGHCLWIELNENELALTSTPPRSSVLKPPCISKSILVVLLIWIIPAADHTYTKYKIELNSNKAPRREPALSMHIVSFPSKRAPILCKHTLYFTLYFILTTNLHCLMSEQF